MEGTQRRYGFSCHVSHIVQMGLCIQVKLIPIEGKSVIEHWGHFIEGMEKIGKYSNNNGNIESTYNDILSKRSILWAGFRDKQYIGFVITQIQQVPFEEMRLLVMSFYAKEKLTDDEFNEGMGILNGYAKKMNIKKMEFYTIRDKAFERYLNNRMWKPKYVVFERGVI